MSDTPRTDAEVFEVDVVFVSYDGPAFEPKNVVEPDFARQLERENAVLRADAERYRYIKNSETMEVSEILQSFCVSITFDLDAAIDAARKEAKP